MVSDAMRCLACDGPARDHAYGECIHCWVKRVDDLDELASIYLTIATRYRVQVTGEDPGDARDAIIEEARGE